MKKMMILLASFLLTVSARTGDLTVDNLTVSNDAAIHGKLDFYSISGTTTNTNSFVATGGTITTNAGYIIHTFISGSNDFTVITGSLDCEVLVVAGGGGGGDYCSANSLMTPKNWKTG